MLFVLLTIPLLSIVIVSSMSEKKIVSINSEERTIVLIASIINLFASFAIYIFHIFSTNQFQLVQEWSKVGSLDFYLGLDGLSIYLVLLIAIIMPIALLSNWSSIIDDIKSFLIIMLLLEILLITVFTVIDTFLFYIFFESILPPLFLLIGIFGSKNRVRASFYLFLYTLFGSLFLLLSILTVLSMVGTSYFDITYKSNIIFYTQIFIFCGIIIAFAVKTPTIFLNNWLLKAHVESPLGGSIVLAAIVLKLSLYGIIRLILPILYKVYMLLTPTIFLVAVITILYASISTLRTIDIKELIAYSSVSHAAVYLLGVFSSVLQGIEGSILLGLGHGFVSSGLFMCTGGVLYDRSSTRLITFYRGSNQIMPLYCILFFILCLGNAGTPLSLNFIGEFLSLYGAFERMPLFGALACSSIVFSAAYTIYLFNRIAFAGTLSSSFKFNLPDLSKREFNILLILVLFTVVLGVYPAPVLDGLHYSTSLLIYNLDGVVSICDAPNYWSTDTESYLIKEVEELLILRETIIFYITLLTIIGLPMLIWAIISWNTFTKVTYDFLLKIYTSFIYLFFIKYPTGGPVVLLYLIYFCFFYTMPVGYCSDIDNPLTPPDMNSFTRSVLSHLTAAKEHMFDVFAKNPHLPDKDFDLYFTLCALDDPINQGNPVHDNLEHLRGKCAQAVNLLERLGHDGYVASENGPGLGGQIAENHSSITSQLRRDASQASRNSNILRALNIY